MAFKVRLFHGSPDYESLHVAKLTCFPLERRDYKPYSQARVCFSHGGLSLQLLAVEAEPLPQSELRAVFRFTGDEPPLTLLIRADRSMRILRGAEDVTAVLVAAEAASLHMFTGEDLQGVFWGGNLFLSAAVMRPTTRASPLLRARPLPATSTSSARGPKSPTPGASTRPTSQSPSTPPKTLGSSSSSTIDRRISRRAGP